MWAVTILDALTFGTFSSFMDLSTTLAVESLAVFSRLVLSIVSVTMSLVDDIFAVLLLEPATAMFEVAQALWNICGPVILKAFSQTAGCLLTAIPSFSTLSGSLHPLPDCSDDMANDYSCPVAYALVLAQNILNLLTSVLPFESTTPLLVMGLLSWLSRPISNTEETRADSIADTYARKCAINRSHTTAPFLGVVYILAACAGIYNQFRSDANLLSLTLILLATWFFRPTIKQWTFKLLGSMGDIERLVAQIQNDRAFRLGFLRIGSEQREQIKALNGSLMLARESENAKEGIIQGLQNRIAGMGQTINQLNNQLRNANHHRFQSEAQVARLNATVLRANSTTASLMGRINSLETALKASREDHQFDKETLQVLLDNTLSGSTSVFSNDTTDAFTICNFSVPFVLVLIDGDAYKWAGSLFKPSTNTPGAKAAQAIKDQVRKYLLKNNMLLQSRIVVRVFHNMTEGATALIGPGGGRTGTRRFADDFARDFTQSMPLFDYLDCGAGKERADSKIQEHVHLFIGNPSCHAIFLAAATDNGFARLLEQYVCDDAMRDKIVLVHPGYIIREIDALGLKAIEWSTVFQHDYMPIPSERKAAGMANAARKTKEEMEVATTKFVWQNTWKELGRFRNLARGGATGVVQKVEGKGSGVNDADIAAIDGGDGEVFELD